MGEESFSGHPWALVHQTPRWEHSFEPALALIGVVHHPAREVAGGGTTAVVGTWDCSGGIRVMAWLKQYCPGSPCVTSGFPHEKGYRQSGLSQHPAATAARNRLSPLAL